MVTLKHTLDRFTEAASNTVRWRMDSLGFFIEAVARGPVVEVPMALARESVFVVSDPDAVATVLNHPDRFTKDTRGQRLLRVVLGVGLLTSEGKTWRARRRIAQPAFRRPKLELYAAQMQRCTERAVATMVAQKRLDLHEAMMRLTLDIAATTLFSDDFDDRAEVVGEALEELLSSFLRLLGNPLPHPERLPTPAGRAYRRAVASLDDVVADLIARRRAKGTDGDDLLHLWLHSGLDDDAVRDEVVTMLLAAHETTANALTATLAELSWHPAIRRRVVAEVAGLDSGIPGRDQAPLLEAVIKEGLRLHPPAWINARAAAGPEILGGVEIPEGSLVLIPIHAMHHDPRVWDNPEGFDPERWDGRPTGVWMPFGAGPRKCIGSHFAMLELRIALATLLRRATVDLEPGVQLVPDPSVTLRPRDPVWVRVDRPTSSRAE